MTVTALEAYGEVYGEYPVEDVPPAGCEKMTQALLAAHMMPAVRERMTDGRGTKGSLADGWRQPLIYRYPARYPLSPDTRAALGLEYNLYSIGRNGKDEQGEGDDIANW